MQLVYNVVATWYQPYADENLKKIIILLDTRILFLIIIINEAVIWTNAASPLIA